jgi:acetylornithine deacetylase/succinyl-diaminopimelate desuccinylase-like protein
MTRQAAIQRATSVFDDGSFKESLRQRIERPTESQNPARAAELPAYLTRELQPALEAMGFECQLISHPKAKAPFLFAQRLESTNLPTVLGYGHGDVIRGLESEWREGVSPWALTELDGRWYGRGIADNKGQHL